MEIPSSLISSLDEAVRNDLRALRNTYFVWLLAFTFTVAIGVTLEGVEYFTLKKYWIDSVTGMPRVRWRLVHWIEWAMKVGWFLVALGVVGEFGVEALMSQADGYLQSFNDTLFAEGRERASSANERAGKAMERAAMLEKESLELRNNLRLTGSRASLLMEPSSQKLFASLKPFRGQMAEVGQCGSSDNEMLFAVTTSIMLLGANGWKLSPRSPHFACSTGMRVVVRYDAPDNVRAAAAALGKVVIGLGLMSPTLKPFEVSIKPHGEIMPGWEPSSADSVLLMVMIHP